MIRKIYFLSLLITLKSLIAQNPANITFPNPQPNPPNLAIDSYSRAATSINLQNGFIYGPISGGATNLLNLNISTYPPYVNSNYQSPSSTPNYFYKNPGLEAKVTTGTPQVDQIGGFNYNIPIFCSPGTAGMEPKLNIVYSSNGENTWLGLGFNIIGISKITRSGKDLFYDGVKTGVKFNNDDVFLMDGARLLQNGSTYKTEIENYNTIKSHGSFGSGPEYFTVSTPGGLTMEYGRQVSARNIDVTGTEAVAWFITKIYDPYGNYMTYDYTNTDGELLIRQINYTGNSVNNLSPYNKIEFEYVERSDDISFSIAGREFRRKHILKTINCKGINNSVVKKYTFDYDYQFVSLLSRITEIDAFGNGLNPTYFEWSNEQKSLNYYSCAPVTASQPNVTAAPLYKVSIPADLNGDGMKDLLLLDIDFGLEAQVKINTLVNICQFSPGTRMAFTTALNSLPITSSSIEYITSFVFDEDDDNIDEVFIVYSEPTNMGSGSHTYFVDKIKNTNGVFSSTNFSTGNVPAGPPSSWSPLSNFHQYSSDVNKSSYFLRMEDLTGDNLKDVISVDQEFLTLIPAHNPSSPVIMNTGDIIKTQLGDFDGDGILDIYLIKYKAQNSIFTFEVHSYDVTNNTLNMVHSEDIDIGNNPNMTQWTVYNNSSLLNRYANAAKSISFGDFNGDGKMDFSFIHYTSSPSNADVNIFISDGQTFVSDNHVLQISTLLNNFEANLSAADINNDGFCDLAVTSRDDANYTSNFDYYPYNGKFLTPAVGFQSYSDKMLGTMSDFNGDGTLDYIGQSGFVDFRVTFNAFDQDNKKMVNHIFNIKDDLKIEYGFLPGERFYDNQNSYYGKTPPLNTDPSFKTLKPQLFVVTRVTDNGRHFSYGYNNAISDLLGKGFLGFEKVYTRDMDKQSSSINGGLYKGSITTSFFNTQFDGVEKSNSIETYLGNNIFYIENAMTSKFSESTLNYTQTGSNRYLSSSSGFSKDYLSSLYNTQDITFDNTSGGMVLSQESKNIKWLSLQLINSVKQDYVYQAFTNPANGSIYYKGSQIKEVKATNVSSSTYVSEFNYDPAGHLTSSVKNSNLPGFEVTTSYSQYNDFGIAKQTSVSAPDLSQPRSGSFQYDATGRFMTQSTNALGNMEKFVYEPSFGNVIEHTGISGLVNKFEYDGLGRLLKTTSPTGAVNTSKYEWHGYTEGFPLQQRYGLKISNFNEGNGSAIVYFNYQGNEIKSESTGFDGRTIVTTNTYDSADRPYSSTQPYFSDQATTNHVAYLYDEYDRIKTLNQVKNNGLSITPIDYSYNTLSTNSIYNKGFVKVKVPSGEGAGFHYKTSENNEAGLTDLVSNYENISSPHNAAYTYNEHNLPLQVVTSFPGGQGGATTTFGYDALGRRNFLIDPSSGSNVSEYNSVGELTLTSNANGQYTYDYDNLGRVLTRVGSGEGTFNYEYVTSGNGLTSLKKITGPNVISEYVYDGFDRMVQKKETLGSGSSSKQFKTEFTYDKYDRLVDYTYPGNFKTTNEYDANGFLKTIKNNTTIIWELNSMKTPELFEEYINSAGLTTQIGYDNLLNLQQIDLGNLSSQTFNFDERTYSMLNRSHNSNSEGFKYDNFDRLIKSTELNVNNQVVTKHNFSYKPNGNFDHKDDCGDYVYGLPAKPYQLTQIQNPTNNISLNTINITHTDFDNVSKITESVSNKEFNFTYGNDQRRIKMEYKVNSQLQYTRYYQDNYDREENGNAFKEWSYVYAPTGLAAVYYNNNGVTELLNVTTDNLGSPLVLTTQNGQIVEEYSFDAWGRRRNPADWTYNNIPAAQKMIRGYTGHEHLDELGIINMNGRVYDPVLGRFIQPDPFIQDPANLQNFNRYSYGFNNPLKYTDPSGYKNEFAGQVMHGWSGDPVLYVDGIRIEPTGGGYSMFSPLGGGGGGGVGVASATYFGGFNGPNMRGTNYSAGFFMDQGLFRSSGYVQLKYVDGKRWRNPITGAEVTYTGKDNAPGPIMQWTVLNNAQNVSIVGAQSGGGLSMIDGLQLGLDLIGLIPVVGEIADGLNAAIYTARGDYANAALSAAAMVPLVGMAATGAKLGKKAAGLTYDLLHRGSKGADGGISRHVIERLDGDVISRTHQVFKDGEIIHQHQNHIGKYGTVRTFPEEWLMFPTIK